MKKKRTLAITAALLLLLGTVGGYLALQRVNAKENENTPVNERTYQVTRGDITTGIDGAGKVEVEGKKYKLPKEISVSRASVQEGDWVEKGRELIKLSGQEMQKYRQLLDEQIKEKREKLEDLEEEQEDYLDSMNWQLENKKDDSLNRYYNRRWELNNRIEELEYELSEAQWKRDYVSDDQLTRSTVEELEAELEKKRKEKEDFEKKREEQEQQEQDPKYQQTLQKEKIEEFESLISSGKKELANLQKRREMANSPKISADKEGVVLKVHIKKGEESVIEVGQKDDMRIRLTVEPEDIVDVKEGQEVEFSLDAYPDVILKGKVVKRILAADDKGKFAALVVLDKGDKDKAEILPGMTASGTLIIKQKKDLLTLPNKAISLRDGKQYVLLRSADGNTEEREIKTGFSDGKLTEILSGLEEGDTVVTQTSL